MDLLANREPLILPRKYLYPKPNNISVTDFLDGGTFLIEGDGLYDTQVRTPA